MSPIRILTGALLALATVSSAFADVRYYVDANNGDDTWDGTRATHEEGTQHGPKQTIGEAVALADGVRHTVITVAPGVYDKGEYYEEGATNRIVITKPRLEIRSSGGRENTFIVGRHDPSSENGLGDAAIRCILIKDDVHSGNNEDGDHVATNIVIRGFTICNGATPAGKSGGGVSSVKPESGGTSLLIDCTVSNCVAASGGAIFRQNAYRSYFINNNCTEYASCFGFGRVACCVIAFNRGKSTTYNMSKVVNCTFAYNEGYTFFGGYDMFCWNSLSFGNANNGEHTHGNGYVHLTDCVTAEPTRLYPGRGTATDSVTNAAVWQCVSPAFGDWRLLAGSPAIGKGDGRALKERFVLPPGETFTDILGNPIDVTGPVDCGAVQAPAVTPTGGRLRFGSSFDTASRFTMPGSDAVASHGAYHYPTGAWSEPLLLKHAPRSSGKPLFWVNNTCEGATGSGSDLRHLPQYDGYVRMVPPPDPDKELVIEAQEANHVLYVDGNSGDDEWDGTSATHVEGSTTGPKKTIQSACDVAQGNSWDWTLVNVAPGVYDDGGAGKTEEGYTSSNRVYVARSIGLRATGGPGSAVIKGAPDPDTGTIGPGAFRCLWINGNGFSQGIDLTGGYTSDTASSAICGGAVYMGNAPRSIVCDCTISNCVAKDCVVGFYGNFVRARIFDCHTTDYEAFRNCNLYGCTVGGMTFGGDYTRRAVFSISCSAWGCTFDMMTGVTDPLNRNALAYLFGNIVYSGASTAVSAGSACNVFTTDPFFVDPVSRDYRIGAGSPALGAITEAAYAGGAKDDWMRYRGGTDGSSLRWRNGAAQAGAYQNEPLATYEISGEGVAVDGGVAGETVVATEVAEITVTATETASRPFIGFEVNGEVLPADQTSYSFTVEPSVGERVTVRALYGNVWYVDQANGDDSRSGGTPATAKRTISGAITNAVSGDTVMVAPGTYADEETPQLHTARIDGDTPRDTVFSVRSRIFVPDGVTLKSIEGPEETVILGQAAENPRDGNTYGLGPDAIRCVLLDGANAKISGFTLAGGHTDYGASYDDCCGGAVLSRNARIENCIISNNVAGRCAGGYKGTFVDCRFFGNTGVFRAAIGRESSYYRCIFDRNRSGEQMIQYFNTINSCTFGPDNRTLDGSQPLTLIYRKNAPTAEIVNSLVLGPVLSIDRTATDNLSDLISVNCAFAEEYAKPSESLRTDCVVVPLEQLQLDSAYVPVIGHNAGIDEGNLSKIPAGSVIDDGKDLAGKSRVMNATMDIGALEADWSGVYANDLGGRRLSTVAVSNEVHEAELHGAVRIPSGAVSFSLDASGARSRNIRACFRVTGTGTLSFSVDGAVVGTYTSGSYEEVVVMSSERASLTFSYEPGENDTGCAELVRIRLDQGLVITVR